MTNACFSGQASIDIQKGFPVKSKGIEHFDLLASTWIYSCKFSHSRRLRADLCQGFTASEKVYPKSLTRGVYCQSNEILNTWRENLAKFVPTEAHNKSVRALLNEGVCLIAWRSNGREVNHSSFSCTCSNQINGNAHSGVCRKIRMIFAERAGTRTNQSNFFGLDDAFGQTQLDLSLTEGWNRLLPLF